MDQLFTTACPYAVVICVTIHLRSDLTRLYGLWIVLKPYRLNKVPSTQEPPSSPSLWQSSDHPYYGIPHYGVQCFLFFFLLHQGRSKVSRETDQWGDPAEADAFVSREDHTTGLWEFSINGFIKLVQKTERTHSKCHLFL